MPANVLTRLALGAVVAWTALPAFAAVSTKLPKTELTESQQVAHILSRVTFGARPGDADQLRELGLDGFIERQLAPETIDDEALASRLAQFDTITMDANELAALFPNNGAVRRLIDQGAVAVEDLPARYARQMDGGDGEQLQREMRRGKNPIFEPIHRFEEPVALRGRQRGAKLLGANPPRLIVMQMAGQKLVRAVHSERQLEELMVDFWMNHFNVFIGKGPVRAGVPGYERDVIRPHAMGTFRELLGATAKAPAMLAYLDNAQSISPESPAGKRSKRGLNENYARELLELHTLGVDGGYTQEDIIEVARVFTGWMLSRPQQGRYEFTFRLFAHHPGPKMVLGQEIPAGGMSEGEKVLDILAAHPSTARFLATKLVRRFVSDEPPQALVNEVAKTYTKTGGDIREMLRTILYSKQFWSPDAYRAKARKPIEYIAATLRAVGADVTPTLPMLDMLRRMGEPLYSCVPPTGYPDMADEWLNSGTLLARWNFAMVVASGKLPGAKLPARDDLDGLGPDDLLDAFAYDFVNGELSSDTEAKMNTILDEQMGPQLASGRPARPQQVRYIAGLVLGSPEFQRR